MTLRPLFVALATLGLTAPCAAQDRWQVTLHSGKIAWDLQLVRLTGDTLIFRTADASPTLRRPVMQVDVLRLVQKAEKRQGAPDGQGTRNGLMGGTDLIWQLTLLDRSERLGVLHQILEDHPPEGMPAR